MMDYGNVIYVTNYVITSRSFQEEQKEGIGQRYTESNRLESLGTASESTTFEELEWWVQKHLKNWGKK